MKFFIKRWPDDTATLMTEAGRVIWIFNSIQESIEGYAEWISANDAIPASARMGGAVTALAG